MGHLYSSRLEKKAIGLICTASKAGRLLFAGLDETHFTRSATRQAFRRIRTLARERNEIPSYDDLCDDSTIDESARTELRQFEYTWEPTLKRALFLSENLTRYRKARLLLDMAEKVTDGLKNQSFDPDKIIRESQDIIDKTRTGKKVPSVSIGGKNDKVLDAVKSALDGKSYRVWPTGFEAFDSVNRGIFEGSYFVLAGDTGGGKCLVGNSLVPTTHGLKTLEELYTEGLPSQRNGYRRLKTGVATHIHDSRTSHAYTTKGKTIRLTTNYGDEAEGLKEHRLWGVKQGESVARFIALSDIKPGDFLAKAVGSRLFAKEEPTLNVTFDKVQDARCRQQAKRHPETLTPDLATLLGLYIAEGNCANQTFHNADPDLMRLFIKLTNKVFGVRYTSDNCRQDKRNAVKAFYLQASIGSFLNAIAGNTTSAFKYVPSVVRCAPEKHQRNFLRALFEGDGTIYVYNHGSEKKPTFKLDYDTISKELALHVKAMLENMGIGCYFRERSCCAANTEDKRVVTAYRITVLPAYYKLFKKRVGFLLPKKQALLNEAIAHFETSGCEIFGQNYNRVANGFINHIPGKELAIKIIERATSLIAQHIDPRTNKSYTLASIGVNGKKNNRWAAYLRALKKGRVRLTRYMATHYIPDTLLCSPYKHLTKALRTDSVIQQGLEQLKELAQYKWAVVETVTRSNSIKPVFDLCVDAFNSYHVNGLVSHNTAMALQIGNNMADAGAKVGMFSLEMTTDELLLREIARRANMSMTKLISGQLLRSEKIKAYKKFKEQHRKYQRDDKRITFLAPDEDIAIEEALYMLKPYGYDVIIIDYITLLKGSGGERQAQALSEISRFCKLYAKANKCVVIMLCQFDSKDAVVRYSRAIREHANNMWVWVRDAKAMETHILTIMQQKARNQRMFIFQLYEDFDKMRVKDVPEDYQPPANDSDDRPAKKYANDKRDRGGGSSNKPSPQQKKRFELQ